MTFLSNRLQALVCVALLTFFDNCILAQPSLEAILEIPLRDTVTAEAEAIIARCTELIKSRADIDQGLLAKALQSRGTAFLRIRDPRSAIIDYEDLCRLQPKNPEARVLLATAYAHMNQLDTAAKCVDAAIDLDSKYALAYCVRGTVLSLKKEHDGAFRAANHAIRLDQKSVGAYYLRGLLSFKKDDPSNCLDDMNQIAKLEPLGSTSETEYPCYLKGICLLRLKRPSEALSNFLLLRRLNAHSCEAAHGLSCTYADLGKSHLALHWAEECVRINDNFADGHVILAAMSICVGNKEKAMKAAESALKLGATDSAVVSAIGTVCTELGQYARAMSLFDKATDIAPHSFDGLIGKASLLATCPDDSIRDGVKSRKILTGINRDARLPQWKKISVSMCLADALAELGEFDAAVSIGKAAVKSLDPDCAVRKLYLEKLASYEQRKPYRLKAPL
jgi:tetratricopeptide (TPR) repeat protein